MLTLPHNPPACVRSFDDDSQLSNVELILQRADELQASRPRIRKPSETPLAAVDGVVRLKTDKSFGQPIARPTTWRSTAIVENVADDYEEGPELADFAHCPKCGAKIDPDVPACHRHLTTVLLKAIRG